MGEPDVVRLRPWRARLVCWICAAAVLVVFTAVATSLHGSTGEGSATFQRGDQLSMVGLGILAAAGILLFTRPRVEADARGVRVRNILGSYDLPWEVVRAVRFGRGSPWATLELSDEESVPMIAVQAADKERAVAGVRALRALHERHATAAAEPIAAGPEPTAAAELIAAGPEPTGGPGRTAGGTELAGERTEQAGERTERAGSGGERAGSAG